MKVYAKQVPPECQESPLFYGDWPESVFVFGNKWLTDHAGRLEDIRRGLEDIAEEYERLQDGYYQNYSLTEILNDYLPRDGRAPYTRVERLELVKLAKNYTEYSNSGDDESAILCDVLELITGKKYDYTTIRGCCQGDWQEIIYPAEYGREWLSDFETEYFNTGAEWIIDDDYSIYTHAWRDDDIRAEIAAAAGVDPGDIVLYEFTGWSKTPEYMEVS